MRIRLILRRAFGLIFILSGIIIICYHLLRFKFLDSVDILSAVATGGLMVWMGILMMLNKWKDPPPTDGEQMGSGC